MTKWHVQKQTLRTAQMDFSIFVYILDLLKWVLQRNVECTAFVRSMTFIGGLNQF